MSIFGIGTVVVDHSVLLDRYPACDTKSNIRQSWKQVGGPVPVALSTASHFGSSAGCLAAGAKTTLVAASSKRCLTEVSISHLRVHTEIGEPGFAQVWVTRNGERTIAYSRGEFPLPLASDICPSLLEDRSILLAPGWLGRRSRARRCKADERTRRHGYPRRRFDETRNEESFRVCGYPDCFWPVSTELFRRRRGQQQ